MTFNCHFFGLAGLLLLLGCHHCCRGSHPRGPCTFGCENPVKVVSSPVPRVFFNAAAAAPSLSFSVAEFVTKQ